MEEEMLRQEWARIMGVDATTIPGIGILTAHTLFTEIGPDLSNWKDKISTTRYKKFLGSQKCFGCCWVRFKESAATCNEALLPHASKSSLISTASSSRLKGFCR